MINPEIESRLTALDISWHVLTRDRCLLTPGCCSSFRSRFDALLIPTQDWFLKNKFFHKFQCFPTVFYLRHFLWLFLLSCFDAVTGDAYLCNLQTNRHKRRHKSMRDTSWRHDAPQGANPGHLAPRDKFLRRLIRAASKKRARRRIWSVFMCGELRRAVCNW